MKLAEVRRFALALPEATEEPHHELSSFRVRGKIFVTVPPDEDHIHVFASEPERELALAMYPAWVESLLWGGKVVGVRVRLAGASPSVVQGLVRSAWRFKAPAALVKAATPSGSPSPAPVKQATRGRR